MGLPRSRSVEPAWWDLPALLALFLIGLPIISFGWFHRNLPVVWPLLLVCASLSYVVMTTRHTCVRTARFVRSHNRTSLPPKTNP